MLYKEALQTHTLEEQARQLEELNAELADTRESLRETQEEREWQERCWKLPQHGGYTQQMLEKEGMEWDETAFEFRKQSE